MMSDDIIWHAENIAPHNLEAFEIRLYRINHKSPEMRHSGNKLQFRNGTHNRIGNREAVKLSYMW